MTIKVCMVSNRDNDLISFIERVAKVGPWKFDVQTQNVFLSHYCYEILTPQECANSSNEEVKLEETDLNQVQSPLATYKQLNLEEFVQRFIPDHRYIIKDCFERALDSGSSFEVKLLFGASLADGHWVKVVGRPVLDEKAKVLSIEGIVQDIQKSMQESIELSKYRSALESLSVIIVGADGENKTTEIHQSLELACEYLGFEVGLLGVFDHQNLKVDEMFCREVRFELKIGQELPIEETISEKIRESDRFILIEDVESSEFKNHPSVKNLGFNGFIGVPLKIKGRPYGVLNFLRIEKKGEPITDGQMNFVRLLGNWIQKKLERTVLIETLNGHLSQEKKMSTILRALFDQNPAALYYADQDNKIQLVNKSFKKLFGLSKKEVIGQSIDDLYADDFEMKSDHEYREKLKNGKKPTKQIICYKKKNESVFVSETIGTLIHPKNNQKHSQNKKNSTQNQIDLQAVMNPGYLGIISDKSSEIEAELKFQQAQYTLEQERAQALENAKMATLGQMAAGISHEINNPLTIVLGLTNSLGRKLDREGAPEINFLREIVGKMDHAALRIKNIIKGLKTLSRDGEHDPFQNENIPSILSDSMAFCQEKIKRKNIQFLMDIPAIEESKLTVSCSAVMLSQVILNLLQNSYDALVGQAPDLPHEEPKGNKWIKVLTLVDNDMVYLRIVDSGHGIDPVSVQNIMNPFYTTKPVGVGTGLGLSISKTICNNHGGDLIYELYEGNTSFLVSIPNIHHPKSVGENLALNEQGENRSPSNVIDLADRIQEKKKAS